MKLKYFGTDGIRGKSFTKLNASLAYKIGQSFKEVFNESNIVIGHDTRDSSPMLAHMVAAGALSTGVNVYFSGIVATPMIAHYSKLESMTGVMVTASHNPYTDNGIKIFNKGYKTNKNDELEIEKYIDGKKPSDSSFGEFFLTSKVTEEYLKVVDKLALKISDLKVVYDSANGANYMISDLIMKKYFPNSVQINNLPDGKNINKDSGSTHLESIIKYIKDHKMDLGFAYDGDGDRVLMIGNDGSIYDGDMINFIIAKHLKSLGELTNNTVVLTKMSNPGILKALTTYGIDYKLTDVGDKFVFEEMINNDYALGGEASGHIILKNILHSGDGLLASLYILKTLIEEEIDLKDVIKEVSLYPFKMVNIENIKKEVLELEHVINYLSDYSNNFEKDDIFFIRASGTEPLIRVTISCKDEVLLNKHMKIIVDYLKTEGAKL